MADEIAAQLRDLIADGALEAGSRINEVEVADRLAVSRTPLREALAQLTAAGFVESRPRRGFFVQELSIGAVRSLYEVRAILDPAALEVGGIPSLDVLDRLDALNERLAKSEGQTERIIDLDDQWHLELVSGCGNPILLDLIRHFMLRTRPLERAYVRSDGTVEVMVGEHARIIELLRADDLPGSVAALRRNMQSGLDPIVRWFEEHHPTAEQMRRT